MKVKICGITNLADAAVAVESGADAIGLMLFRDSPRSVDPKTARSIVRSLPPFVAKVGVFVDADEGFVQRMIEETGIDTLQFHGDESPEFCAQFRLPVIKAFRIRDRESIARLKSYATAGWLLDSFVPGKQGGTGERFNWDLAVEARGLGRPILLAGGLEPGNIAEAVAKVRPYGVDVSSGVESAPGRKDAAKVRDFISAAKQA